MKLAEKMAPGTEASARALGYYGRLPMPESWGEAQEQVARAARRYFWFPAEALDEVPQTVDEMAHYQRHSRLRILSVETRLVWALSVWQAETMRKEAEAYSAATRGLFRHHLREMGFYAPDPVERALRAFLAGKRVYVEHKLNAPSRLLVDGKLVAENVIAVDLRMTPLADADGHAREVVHGSHPDVV